MRLATILGLQHDKWICIDGGNAAEVRPRFKSLKPADLAGMSEVQYFDTDGLRTKRKVRAAEQVAPPKVKKGRVSKK